MTKLNIIIFVSSILYVSNCIECFQLGKSHDYIFTNEVKIIDFQTNQNFLEYKLNGKLTVSAVWAKDDEKLLKLELTSPKLYLPSKKGNQLNIQPSPLDTTKSHPYYIYQHSGKISKIFLNEQDDTSILNLKKGISSLFQYQLTEGDFIEEDTNGRCQVNYKFKKSLVFYKTKTNCENDKIEGEFQRSDKPIGFKINPDRSLTYHLGLHGHIEKIVGRELYQTSFSDENSFQLIESLLRLEITGDISSSKTLSGPTINDITSQIKDAKENDLSLIVELKKCSTDTCPSFVSTVKNLKKQLDNDNIGKEELAIAFIKLFRISQHVKTDEFVRVLIARTVKTFKEQLLDILGATQTSESHEAFKQVLKCNLEEDVNYCERYLQALSISAKPNKNIIEDLLSSWDTYSQTDKLKDSFIQTIASMAQRYTRTQENTFESNIVIKVQQFILKSLEQCEDSNCKVIYIRGLQNLESPKTIPILMKIVLNGERILSVTAIKALRQFCTKNWTNEHRKIFENIFHQKTKRFDSTVRTNALDILLSLKPDINELKILLNFLKSNDKSFEVKQFLLQRINMIADECPKFKEKIEKIIRNDQSLNNYNIIGQKGLSTALSRRFSGSPSFNASLVSIQEMSSGVLKTGTVNLIVESKKYKFNIFSLGMYAGGLSSFVNSGGSEDNEEDDEQANAGMEIIVQGSYLRPLQFFSGQGELMGHVWSGTASDPTPAYQATTILQNHKEYLRLQSGVIVLIDVLGAVTIDLNGQISFSIWNRNANSHVRKYSAFAINAQLNIDLSYLNLKTDITISEEPKLNLITDIDFSSNVMLCMQLSQPDAILRYKIKGITSIPTTKYLKQKSVNLTYNLPGFTHALNQKNNEMCNVIIESS